MHLGQHCPILFMHPKVEEKKVFLNFVSQEAVGSMSASHTYKLGLEPNTHLTFDVNAILSSDL